MANAEDHIRILGHRENIKYFLLDDKENRNLTPNSKYSEYFITKQPNKEMLGYFYNLGFAEDDEDYATGHPVKPIQTVPQILQRKTKASAPLEFKNVDLFKISFFPPF